MKETTRPKNSQDNHRNEHALARIKGMSKTNISIESQQRTEESFKKSTHARRRQRLNDKKNKKKENKTQPLLDK